MFREKHISRAVLLGNMTKDPSYSYGTSMSGMGRHYKARKNMLQSAYDRDLDETLKPSNAYLDLRKSKKLHKCK